jgi:exodeoxyribonuclease VIII
MSVEVPEFLSTAKPRVVPEIGVHDVDLAVYHSWDAASNSRLQAIADRSPAYCRHVMDVGSEDTAATIRGTAVHCAILEPEQFEKRFVLGGFCEASLKTGDRAGLPCGAPGLEHLDGEWRCGKHKGIKQPHGPRILSPEEWDKARFARDAVFAHPVARQYLAGAHVAERSYVWTDERTGLLCKARPDLTCEGGVLLDVKSTRSTHPDHFPFHVRDYGLHRQVALYIEGCRAHGVEISEARWIAIEDTAPFEVRCPKVGARTIEIGAMEVREYLATYAYCKSTGVWPGYPHEDDFGDLPESILREYFPEDFQEE